MIDRELRWTLISKIGAFSAEHAAKGLRSKTGNCIGSVMVSVLPSSAVDYVFEPWLDQTKDYKICNFCFCAKHSSKEKEQRLVGLESG